MGQRRSYQPQLLDRLIILDRFGKDFLSAVEHSAARRKIEDTLVRFLARSLLRGQNGEFWRYQEGGYRTMGRSLPRLRIFLSALDQILDVVLNPKHAFEVVLARLRRGERDR
jgi:hypothetical protein